MPAGLTTHVLDTALGLPAAGIDVELHQLAEDGARRLIATATTNADGRTDHPLAETLAPGVHELVFHVAGHLATHHPGSAGFLTEVPIRFTVTDPGRHHHVPLLLSPHGYTTYRGS